MTRAGIPLGSWQGLQPGAAPAASSAPVALANESVQDYWIPASAARSAANDNLLTASGSAAIDTLAIAAGYGSLRSFYIQIIGSSGISAGAVTIEGSNDNTTFQALSYLEVSVGSGATWTGAALTIAASTSRFIEGPTSFRYLRLRISTGFTGGTVTAIAKLSVAPFPHGAMTVLQNTAANLLTTSTPVTPTAHTLLTANTTNATSAKASAGTLFSVVLTNPIATAAYFKLYNKASAPTVGTDVPVAVFAVPASGSVIAPLGAVGLRFGTGIAYAVTAAAADSDTANAVAGVHIFLAYV